MKKILLLFVCSFAFFSCDDGDLTLEEIDFNSTADIDACTTGTSIEAGVTLLFKINGDETLILEIPDDLIVNEVTATEVIDDVVTPIPREEALNSSAFCYYRSFDDTITSAYFCDELPSDTNIALEYTAVSGTVQVTTVEAFDEDNNIIGYDHTINLALVVFTGTNGQDVRYDLFEYGEITTSL